MSAQQISEVDLLLTGSACPSSWDHLSTKFSCSLLFGPTVVPYFACNEGFIYWLLNSYVCVFFLFVLFLFSCHFPRLLFVCNCFWYWFFSVLLAFLLFSRYLSMRCLGLWDFDQDALLDGPIQGLADRRKTTVLSSKTNCSSLLYHRAYRKWKKFAVTQCLTGMFSSLNPFMFHCT